MNTQETNFIAQYRQNLDCLKNKVGSSVIYRVFGHSIIFQSQIQEFLVLLAKRLGCFFIEEKIPPVHYLKLSKKKDFLILTKPDGNEITCKHFGEIFFPYLAHVFDDIYRSLNNHLVFHAASVEIEGNGLMLIGKSGVGKTTLVLNMIKKGYNYLADDVSILKLIPFTQLLPNPQGIKIKCKHTTDFNSPHTYKNPYEIPSIEISKGAKLSGALLLFHPQEKPPKIGPLESLFMRDSLQAQIIPPQAHPSCFHKCKKAFSNIPVAVAQPQKGNPDELVFLIKKWFEERL